MASLPGKKIKSYEDLIVWQEADSLVAKIYLITRKFPQSELYGLVSQMRRAAISIAANIVEGSSRRTRRDFCNFLVTALGSLYELGYYLKLSVTLGYLTPEDVRQPLDQIDRLGKMLNSLISSLRRDKGQ